ncbi:N-acetyltransferase [Parahaliea mediterranea]|uniref:N-acetyltransferase n=2 Tax=Parahaliea mediterranea TaxID=651086 RepID=A0A939DDX4_9GAMM|nr:N-acetyltransferase [Parahaliea mediterranea]
MVREASEADAAAVSAIYNHYIEHTVVTFEETPLPAAALAARIAETRAAALPWLVAVRGGEVLGYAYAGKWKGRCAFRYTVEVTVYLAPGCTGRGIGKRLYGVLFRELAVRGYHCAIGGIALPNAASVALHEHFGMEKVAHFREVGYKFERWIDVGYWQGMLAAHAV